MHWFTQISSHNNIHHEAEISKYQAKIVNEIVAIDKEVHAEVDEVEAIKESIVTDFYRGKFVSEFSRIHSRLLPNKSEVINYS